MSDTTSTSTPLPFDVTTVREFYLPPEPTATSVTVAREAIALLSSVIGAQHADFRLIAQHDRDCADDLAALATEADDPVDVLEALTCWNPGEPAECQHRLELLSRARQLATAGLDDTERTDPVHLAWRARCHEIEDEWRSIMWSLDDQEKLTALSRFVDKHRQP